MKHDRARIWRRHAYVVVAALVSAGFVALADRTLLAPSHGGWISLDLRGLLLAAYGVAAATYLTLATLGVAVGLRRGWHPLTPYLGSLAVMLALAGAGFAWSTWDAHRATGRALEAQTAANHTVQLTRVDWPTADRVVLTFIASEPVTLSRAFVTTTTGAIGTAELNRDLALGTHVVQVPVTPGSGRQTWSVDADIHWRGGFHTLTWMPDAMRWEGALALPRPMPAMPMQQP